MTTEPIDVENLLGELDDPAAEPFAGLPDGTTMGHVHFRVADVDATVGFYHDVLGLGLMAQLGPAAAFLSAGGYHHHVGANTWESRGASPAPPGTATLRHATIILPDESERDRVAAAVADAGQEPERREDGAARPRPVRQRAAARRVSRFIALNRKPAQVRDFCVRPPAPLPLYLRVESL